MQNQERGSSNIAAILPSTSSTAGAADAAAVLAASGIQSPMPALGGGWRKPSRREETEILNDYIEELKEGFKTLRVLEGTRNVEKDYAHTLGTTEQTNSSMRLRKRKAPGPGLRDGFRGVLGNRASAQQSERART